MPTPDQTVAAVTDRTTWDARVAAIRLVPQHHGTGEHQEVYASIARELYLPHLAPDFAYYFEPDFYTHDHFQRVYDVAERATGRFTQVDEDHLTSVIADHPQTLLVFRSITGLLKNELAHATKIVAERDGAGGAVSSAKVDSMEKSGSTTSQQQARLIARTLGALMDGTLFGAPPVPEVKLKQQKPDSAGGWASAAGFASQGVPYATFLHQRHYGGSFRQVLDATSSERGNLIEDAVEELAVREGIPHIRTGSHNQYEPRDRFGIVVTPAPDFVFFDDTGTVRAMMECKGANDGGTARDKALRFKTLRDEAQRLGGIPLIAVLGGIGWARVNDTLGPVVRDTEGRVFTLGNLEEMLDVAPFPQLRGLATP
ncbi:MAG TPA: hypothetical protein VMF51_02515 [Nocardioides sp.]|uniref:hypothetical protein n=1 Tax=Nocardioides sp. TaxID=35761 RepID=UPI002C1ABEC8|nr:hypothetical protein [Nocardioides sp.]HTW13970.1 hypothetical protein [Nocardioides sp.]